jgi:RNA polymerase sigma factor (sigma-70 family)
MGDTADVVQEVLLQTFLRLDRFDNRGKGAFQAYLRQGVLNRIADQIRTVVRRPVVEIDDGAHELTSVAPSPFDSAAQEEWERAYKQALTRLNEDERLLAVGRLELEYSYEQLALMTGRATPGSARIAARRAVAKLAHCMSEIRAGSQSG